MMVNPQQYRLRENRSGRKFLAHRSRMRKTTLEQLAEDGRRTVLLRPGLPLEDVVDSTVMEEPTQQEDQVKETKDEILNEPRWSEAERAPEPVTEILNGTESHVRVLDWLEKALPEAAGPEAQENERREVEAEAEAEMEAEAPPVLLTEHPWGARTAEDFWNQLEDEVMVEAESDGEREAEPRRKPRRDDYMDHEDRQRQPKTRDQRRTSLDERRQETRDQKWRRNIEAEGPSWSSIVKSLQPKFLRTDQYKSLVL